MELNVIRQADPQVADAIEAELNRQRSHIELIASENFVSPAVMAAMGSCLTNKYAEGYPAHRYYGGCECVDVVENLARDRAKQLFGCEYVNVQPHSGAQANTAVYFAMLQPGDTVMGMACQTAAISRTAARSTCPASTSILCPTAWMRRAILIMTPCARWRWSASRR